MVLVTVNDTLSAIESLVVSMVPTWLDYGKATLAGLPACNHRQLQIVLNARTDQNSPPIPEVRTRHAAVT